jgi:hypothetical protein
VQPTIFWHTKYEAHRNTASKKQIRKLRWLAAVFVKSTPLALTFGASKEETGGLANFGSFHGNRGAM